jgi:plasmid maintenance system antidote protein VapI
MAKKQASEPLPLLADSLKEAIQNSGLTAYRVAKMAGVTQPVIDRFTKGERGLTLETAGKIAQVLGYELVKSREIEVPE